MHPKAARDPGEAKALADIEKYGCHVINVLADGDLPPFCYSVGIQKSCGAPELIVIGLKAELAHFMINEYNNRVKDGGPLQIGKYYSGFIEGFDCLLQSVDKKHYGEYFGWDTWLYEGLNYSAVQLIYPTKSGVWPWQPEAADIKKWQPILTPDELPTFT